MSEEKVDLVGRNSASAALFVDTGHDGETGYSTTTGLALSSDWSPTNEMHGLLLDNNSGASITGVVDVTLKGGGRMVIEVTVADGNEKEFLRGYCITTVHSSTTTTFKSSGGLVFPLY